MKEIPLLFSDEMVVPILRGRKTVTRRVCKVQPVQEHARLGGLFHVLYPWGDGGHGVYKNEAEMRVEFDRLMLAHSPYGKAGDRMYVRENHCLREDSIVFRADRGSFHVDGTQLIGDQFYLESSWTPPKWRPNIHHLRRYTRFTGIIVSVTLERLQDLTSPDEAVAEGVTCWMCGGPVDGTSENDCGCFHSKATAVESYQVLWDDLNRDRGFSWKDNPMVWRIEFKKEQES